VTDRQLRRDLSCLDNSLAVLRLSVRQADHDFTVLRNALEATRGEKTQIDKRQNRVSVFMKVYYYIFIRFYYLYIIMYPFEYELQLNVYMNTCHNHVIIWLYYKYDNRTQTSRIITKYGLNIEFPTNEFITIWVPTKSFTLTFPTLCSSQDLLVERLRSNLEVEKLTLETLASQLSDSQRRTKQLQKTCQDNECQLLELGKLLAL